MRRLRRCCCCGFADENKKLFWDINGRIGDNFICRNCAKEIGKDGFFKAGLISNTAALKKYVRIHPEAQIRYNDHLMKLKKYKDDLKKEFQELSESKPKQALSKSNISNKTSQERTRLISHLGCTKEKQTKCTCKSCGKVFFYSEYDVKKNKATVFAGSAFALSQMKDLNRCPDCGSIAIEKKQVFCWIDSNGSCVDVEE